MGKLLFYVFLFLLVSCDLNYVDNDYFIGNINVIEDSVSVKNVRSQSFAIEGVYNGPVFVYDSLLIYYPLNRTATSSYEIYNLKDLSLIGEFCGKGVGPNEIVAFTTISHFYKENGELKTLLYGANEKKLVEWNISKSLAKHTTVFDRIVSYDWDVDKHVTVYNKLFRLNTDTILAITPTVPLTLDQELVSLPLYEKRTIETNKQVKLYDIFHKYPENNGLNVHSSYNILPPERFLESFYCIKPDCSKMVQVMMFMPQINILDLQSGEVNGFRLNSSVNFSVFRKNIEKVNYCFTGVAVDDEFIYALYWGRKIKDDSDKKRSCIVYVFNWAGVLVNKIDLENYVNQIFLDEKNNILYGREYTSDYIYSYDLSVL
ncbi:hypothetical protein CE91St1_06400 [Parabacteroides goldsteinii]|nr:BF3164 family lipoprotein [Parabacteroides goldsteinii]GKG71497.1 hypothetical protein CE91St1_06400 [Parabacteroides goldsteinii]GKG82677.1 hypothetical protein CE91St2_58690 [Parabacteroides goldsteinii]